MNLNETLHSKFNTQIENAYIIRIAGHSESENLAARCAQSCEQVGQNYRFFDAIDGTSGGLRTPDSLKDCTYLKWLKVMDHELSVTEVACALSHFALWVRCLELDRPIVILEHDAVMVKAYTDFQAYNQIVYLGGAEQVKGWPVLSIPPHATLNPNYHFICRAHAYAIDPAVAKNLVAHVIRYGIHESLDIMMRADIFPITQMGFYAYDVGGETTIVDRKKAPKGAER
ncbi:glycosyltransferase family 25 protein [Bdellovibrio sp. HCB337]|uniref:glycosyltransferase family 25 protein n=1 Tax=Bdellovibrio sp. HCB337 TaxID=3394358 RepID=UPI0039A7509E